MKIKICAIGECMMELTNAKMKLYSQSIAGDTLNFISYLDKKIFETSYFTAVGRSEISKRVIIMSKRYSGKSQKDRSFMKKAKLNLKEKRKLKREKKNK